MFGSGGQQGSSFKTRLIIAAVIAIFALVSYYGNPGDENRLPARRNASYSATKPTKCRWVCRPRRR